MALSIFRPVLNKINNFVRNPLLVNKNVNLILTTQFSQISPLQGETSNTNEETNITKGILQAVNDVQKEEPSRTFAVVQVCGKQFKVTGGDAIIIEGYWPPTTGDKIRLDKVLLAGSKDFSLIGTPLVENGLVEVNATVVEKCLSHTRTHFRKKRRKQYMRIHFYRCERTVLRINDIRIGQLDEDV